MSSSGTDTETTRTQKTDAARKGVPNDRGGGKPPAHSLQQEPAEGSREVIEHELERSKK